MSSSATPSAPAAAVTAAAAARPRIGLCTFSCALHWKAVAERRTEAKFADAAGFFEYARSLGAEGVQTSLPRANADAARRVRDLVERTGGFYEGELRLPKSDADLPVFETDVRLAREAGARVARGVLLGGRRYEVFHSLAEFHEFRGQADRTLALAEPVLRRHGLRLAVENHKDLTVPELTDSLRRLGSEWVGALVDTGNSIALLEDPYAVVEALAPFAASVHFKDMAVAPHDDGFLLSEVPLGTGCLDLDRITRTLTRARPGLVFNLEMATRDPLRIPCLEPVYWATFPERRAAELAAALAFVQHHAARQPLPRIGTASPADLVALEEANNRPCLAWMNQHLRS